MQAEEGDRPFWNFVESWGVRNRGEEPCWRQLQRFAGERLSPAMEKVCCARISKSIGVGSVMTAAGDESKARCIDRPSHFREHLSSGAKKDALAPGAKAPAS